jgi:hypothetical protein
LLTQLWFTETIAYVPTTQKNMDKEWFGAHDPFENGSWVKLFDGTNGDTGLPQRMETRRNTLLLY